jgi:hypothetical protein
MSYKQGKYDSYLKWTVDKKAGTVTVTANIKYNDGAKSASKRIEIDASTVRRVLLGAGIEAERLISGTSKVNSHQPNSQTGQWVWTTKGHNENTTRTVNAPRKTTRKTTRKATRKTVATRTRTSAKKTLTNEKTTVTLDPKNTNTQEGG